MRTSSSYGVSPPGYTVSDMDPPLGWRLQLNFFKRKREGGRKKKIPGWKRQRAGQPPLGRPGEAERAFEGSWSAEEFIFFFQTRDTGSGGSWNSAGSRDNCARAPPAGQDESAFTPDSELVMMIIITATTITITLLNLEGETTFRYRSLTVSTTITDIRYKIKQKCI